MIIFKNIALKQEWDDDPSMTMVLIKGAGDKAFCAGGDIRGRPTFITGVIYEFKQIKY